MEGRAYIGGAWTEGRGDEVLEVRSPATGEVLGRFGGASATRTGWGRVGRKWGLMNMTDPRNAVIDYWNARD